MRSESEVPAALVLSTDAISGAMRRRALFMLAGSALAFVALVPLAPRPLAPVPGFISVYQSALIVSDLVTALLLYGQFRVQRLAGLGLLGAGYLFTALVAFVHMLTFPGLFAPGGWLGAGPQTTAWLYMFWHAGFPLTVIAYALMRNRRARRWATPVALTTVMASVAGLAMLATLGANWLPAIMVGNRYTAAFPIVLGTVWMICPLAVGALWIRRGRSVLDVWLMVVMTAWFFDIGLSAVFNAGRFDLGFYAGRIYGLLASTYVLAELLIENAQLHRRLTESHERERARVAELAAARDAAMNADEAKGRFLSTMSHEIRTPMNAILGLTHLALDTDLDARQRDYLSKVNASSKSLMRLLDDILDYSKIEAEQLALEDELFELESVIENVASLFSARAEESRITLLVELDPQLPPLVIGDALRLSQALNNLVGNALKFTPADGEVVIGAELLASSPDDAVLRFFVKDSGMGMSQAQIDKLFKPFSQADRTIARRFGGTGLGLAICKRLAELMGGSISVTSVPGHGSVFSITARLRVAKGGKTPTVPQRGLRTLLIDPQETSSRILCQVLESWHFEVTHAEDASAALAHLRQAEAEGRPHQLVLLDEKTIGIGDDGGLAHKLHRATHSAAANRLSIVILVSTSSMEHTLALAGAIPADSVLTKPTTPSRLLDAVVRIEHEGRARSKPKPTREPWSPAMPGLRGARVLLVEDNPINQQVATEMIKRAGLEVTVADNGLEAVDRLESQSFDLVLMDVQMPVMDGLQATRLLRRLPNGEQVPVVAMTASALAQDRQDCLDAGMNSHLPKPIDPHELEATLLQWIKPGEREAGADAAPAEPPGEADALAQHLPGIDVKRALDCMGGDMELYRRLLSTYVERHHADGERALQCVVVGDHESLARTAHELAGVAAMLGITEVESLARELSHPGETLAHNELPARAVALRDAQRKAVVRISKLLTKAGEAHASS